LHICFAYATGSQTCILYALLVPPTKYFILFSYTIKFQRIRLLLMLLSANSLLRSYKVNVLPQIFSYMFQTACNKPLWQVNEHEWLTLGLRSKKSSYFYVTGYTLYPCFLDYFLNFFFHVRLIGSTEVKILLLFRFLIFYAITESEILKIFEDKKI
jgi:hypothetical protein